MRRGRRWGADGAIKGCLYGMYVAGGLIGGLCTSRGGYGEMAMLGRMYVHWSDVAGGAPGAAS